MELLTTKEAALFLRMTAGTLNVWRSNRRYPLRFVKVGRSVRYRREDLLTFLNSRNSDAPAPRPGTRKKKAA